MVQIWTDGSHERTKDGTRCGIGILIRRLTLDCENRQQKVAEHRFSIGLKNVADNNLAELYAIEYALYKLSQIKLHPKDKKLVIITDSKTAIGYITGKNIPLNPTYKEVVGDVLFRLQRYDYKIYWKKGHSDCERQNLCDALAKKGRIQHAYKY